MPLKQQNSWTTREKPRIYDSYGVLECVAWIWRIMGLFPLTIKGCAGMKKYGISKFFAIYTVSIMIICIGDFFYVINEFGSFLRDNAPMIWAILIIRATASMLSLIKINIWRIIRFNELSEIIVKISDQEKILEKMNCPFNYESNGRIIRAYVLTMFMIIIFATGYDVYISSRVYNSIAITWFIWIISPTAQVMNITIFVSLVGLIGLKFRSINEKIRTIVTRANAASPKVIVTSDVCAKNLRALSKVHYNICAIGKRINRIFDWDLVINVTVAFIIMSTTLYGIFDEFHRESETNINQIVSFVNSEILLSAPIIVIVIICNWTSGQAIYAGKLIHEIRVESTDSRLYETVKSFSLQLHHQKLEFTAAGLFPLNSTLLQTMVGSITTYLIILIQFQPKFYIE